ncbi:methyltransferase domain-containing protein [Rhodophyticola sp.]|uniref:class I SAM-dependent methyltransferase n=1 Tax=Rhodophyticola sp. TaxID=2680032 RepID=UPI003D2D0F84
MAHPRGPITDRQVMYREMQRTIPGLDAMYRLVHALIASHAQAAPQVLVVGAGGGREIEEFRNSDSIGCITAIDPSARNLETARAAVGRSAASPDVSFIVGTVDDLPDDEKFDIVTSLLVMHHLPDDGSKLDYLRGLRQRLAPGGQLIHADVCFDENEDFDRLTPALRAHADILGVSADAVRLELEAIPKLPVVSGARTGVLFSEAGLTEPQEVFRTLWYRCWVSTGSQI